MANQEKDHGSLPNWEPVTNNFVTSNRFFIEPFGNEKQVIKAYDEAFFGSMYWEKSVVAAQLPHRIAAECSTGHLHMAAVKLSEQGPALAMVSLVAHENEVLAISEMNTEILKRHLVSSTAIQMAAQMWSSAINNRKISANFTVEDGQIISNLKMCEEEKGMKF